MSTFYELIFSEKKDWDEKLLITNKNQYSLNDLHKKVEELTSILTSLGKLKGEKVAVLIPDLPIYFSLFIAINNLGGTIVPLNHQYRNEDLTKILHLIRPTVIFTVRELNKIPFKEIITDGLKTNSVAATVFTYENGLFEKECIDGKKEILTTEGIDLIACTSGSTGLPKGIKLSVDSIEKWTHALLWGLEIEESDRILLTIPITAPYGICWLLTGFMHRIQMVIPEGFDMLTVINLLKEHPCNKFSTTPSIFKGIYTFGKHISPVSLDYFKLGILAGEQINDEFIKFTKEFQSCRLKNHYGLSEQGVLMFTNDIRSNHVEWSIAAGNHYQVNETTTPGMGELMIKTPHGFEGYYLNKELTNESLTNDGWFSTGDLVRVNERGKIEIVGRKKQLIKKGGAQVIPAEVEQVLNRHKHVAQSVVIGIPHSTYGEDVVAFIVPAENLDTSDLYSFVRERISNYKVPGKIIEIKELPVIQGKLDRVTLRDMAVSSR